MAGRANAVGDVNLAILRLLNAEGVQIPFPQRVVHDRPATLALPTPTPSPTPPPTAPSSA